MRYSGLNGTIIVEDDALVLLRSGVSAKLSGQSKQPYRRIPLSTITGAELRPASRAINGSLTVVTQAGPAPRLTASTAASHPDTVLYRWRDRAMFAALHQWLREIGRFNADDQAPAPRPLDVGPPTGGEGQPARPATRLASRRGGRAVQSDAPVLGRGDVQPPGAVVEVRWVPPVGWPEPEPQWWPPASWMPADDWPGDGRNHTYWRVVAPAAAVEAAETPRPERPSDWRDRAPESEWLRWDVSTLSQRMHMLNQLEGVLASARDSRRRWHEAETSNAVLGVSVPDDDPAFASRERGWFEWMNYLSATRDWLLHAVVTNQPVPEPYFAWREQFDEQLEAYLTSSKAPEYRLSALEEPVLNQLTPEQRQRYWFGGPAEGTLESWQDAEELAATALRRCGFEGARRTNPGADGGLDVISPAVAAQVKYTSAPVGRPVLQQLQGAAGGRVTVFFARAGYTRSAREYAEQVGMALFTLALPTTIAPVNQAAASLANRMSR